MPDTAATLDIRILSKDDAPAYHRLRLEGLREAPTAFGSSYKEEVGFSPAQVEARLTANLPHIATFGAFLDGVLVGIATHVGNTRLKTRHKSGLAGMYVTGSARGHGIGRRLVDAVIAHARTLPDVEEIAVTVTVGNEGARRLYLSTGFEPVAVMPHDLKVDSQYYDMEWMEQRLS